MPQPNEPSVSQWLLYTLALSHSHYNSVLQAIYRPVQQCFYFHSLLSRHASFLLSCTHGLSPNEQRQNLHSIMSFGGWFLSMAPYSSMCEYTWVDGGLFWMGAELCWDQSTKTLMHFVFSLTEQIHLYLCKRVAPSLRNMHKACTELRPHHLF